MKSVIVRVPATTSNLGPGFDCLGVALRIYNFVIVRRSAADSSPSRIMDEAGRLFFKQSGVRPFKFSAETRGDVPQSRGLGSSVTVRLGVLHGLNELSGRPCDRSSIFQMCAGLEGHPDNAAPASFGGFTVAGKGEVQRFRVSPRLSFVLLVPDHEVATSAARRVLPPKVQRRSAVETCGNACAITAAFVSRDYESMRGAFRDYLHQPFRRKLNPLMMRVIEAAENAGALGGYLSGSGSTICALVWNDPAGTAAATEEVARAMRRAAGRTQARVLITSADNRGVQIRIRNPKSEVRNW